MAEEKQFEPTHSRVEKAKREGDVARSQEIGNVAAFAAGLFAVTCTIAPLAAAALALLRSGVRGTFNPAPLASAFTIMLLPAAAAMCAAAAVHILQAGGLRWIAIRFKPERVAPVENLKRIFSRESLVTASRATVAFICAGAAIVPAFAGIYAAALHGSDLARMAATAWTGALHAACAGCVVGGIFAGADYGLQFVRWRKRLRMSHDELRRDHKEQDGDPIARGRRRARHRQLSRGALRKVKDAAFVVTNPTHIAIALEYRPPGVAVPRVLVRAADEAAARVRELAAEHRIPAIENVQLARTLYATSRAGEYIPLDTYVAVAEIVGALVKAGALNA